MTNRIRSARKIGWMLAISFVLLLPAIWNRFPLLYSDSGEYLLSALSKRPPRVRTAGYGLWMWATGGTFTLWAPIIAQALLVGALLVRAVTALEIALTPRVLLAMLAALLATGAPWMTSEAMPDVFAGAVLLATWLALAHWARLGAASRALVGGTIIVGVATHVTMPVVFGALLLLVAVAGSGQRLTLPPLRVTAAVAGGVALAVVALATFNWVRTDRVALTRKPSVFVLGHLVESGLASRVLADRCAVEPFALCPFQAGLQQPIETFIWNDSSPFYKAYQTEDQLRDDTRHLVGAVLVHEPLGAARSVVSYGARQFVNVEVFDKARTQPANTFTRSVLAFVLPHEEQAMLGARQEKSAVSGAKIIDGIILAALIASLGLSLWLMRDAFRRGAVSLAASAGLQLYLWAALVINALVCANLSGVFGRYQGRLAWLLPVLVAVTLANGKRSLSARGVRSGE
ncbi:MAG: hypothetical protein ACJ79K_11655 [Gemmatimonadaceae bacterium]